MSRARGARLPLREFASGVFFLPRRQFADRSPAGVLLDLDRHDLTVETLAIFGVIEQPVRLGAGIRARLCSAAEHRSPLIAHQGSAPCRPYSGQVTPPIETAAPAGGARQRCDKSAR